MEQSLRLPLTGVAAFTSFAIASLASASSLPAVPLARSIAASSSLSSDVVHGVPVCSLQEVPTIQGAVACQSRIEPIGLLHHQRFATPSNIAKLHGEIFPRGTGQRYCTPMVAAVTTASSHKGHSMIVQPEVWKF